MTMQHSSYKNEHGELELVPGTLRGYRCWRNETSRHWLTSTNWDFAWSPRYLPEAQCLHAAHAACCCAGCATTKRWSHPSPSPQCSCGYYASYSPTGYLGQITVNINAVVNGTISAHGRIILGTGGFRAQWAKVDALWGENSLWYAGRYNVPWFRTRDEMIKVFPPSDITELIKAPGSGADSIPVIY